MHGEEQQFVKEAFDTNWVAPLGKNVDEFEKGMAKYIGIKYAAALNAGTAALHLAVKLAAGKLYGSSSGISTPDGLGRGGSLYGRRVFCTDMTFDATVNPVVYKGG